MRTDVPTVSEVVERAAAHCDPDGHDDAVIALIERFEDDDRPARAVEGLSDLTHSVVTDADPEGDSPAATMAAVAAAWLATNADHFDDRERVLRESASAAYRGSPPPAVRDWLAEQGLQL